LFVACTRGKNFEARSLGCWFLAKPWISGLHYLQTDWEPRVAGVGEIQSPQRNNVDARELYDAMLEIYPERANPGSLWGGANKAKELAQWGKIGVAKIGVAFKESR
jgi:hypothetical protein